MGCELLSFKRRESGSKDRRYRQKKDRNLHLRILFYSPHCREIGKDRVLEPWRLHPDFTYRLLCGFALQAVRRRFKPLSLFHPLPAVLFFFVHIFLCPSWVLVIDAPMHAWALAPWASFSFRKRDFLAQESMKDGGMSLLLHIYCSLLKRETRFCAIFDKHSCKVHWLKELWRCHHTIDTYCIAWMHCG